MSDGYKRKLIEVALPLDDLNKESVRENYIYRGNPSALQKWWAQRPFAVARAVLFAQLVDDPSADTTSFPTEELQEKERQRLFNIVREIVKWENSTNETVLNKARHEIRKSCDGKLPTVFDPFAGGGTIPLEAQRLGLTANASDLNPVSILINKALIEISPTWSGVPPIHPNATRRIEDHRAWRGVEGLAEDVHRYGEWIRDEAYKRIGHFYPDFKLSDEKEVKVIAWIWARTVICHNPACGRMTPLVRTMWLSKRKGRECYVKPVVTDDGIRFDLCGPGGQPRGGNVGRNGAECLLCSTPIPLTYIRDEGREGRIGQQLVAVAAEGVRNRYYLPASHEHVIAAQVARPEEIPESKLPEEALGFRVQNYGMTHHVDLFTNRQLVAMKTFCDLVTKVDSVIERDARQCGLTSSEAKDYAHAVTTFLAFVVSKLADYNCTGAVWYPKEDRPKNMFALQTVPMVWDFPEVNVFAELGGSWNGCLKVVREAMEGIPEQHNKGVVEQGDATALTLPPGAVVSTDPPYYDNVPYADLSDFFYVWLRRSLRHIYPDLLGTLLSPKAGELVAEPFRHGGSKEANKFFEGGFVQVFSRIRDGVSYEFPMTVYYAFKQTESSHNGDASTGWETLLEGMIRTGWAVTATWPMRTERTGRRRDLQSNALASSIVLACRPRPTDASPIDRRGFLSSLRAELPIALRELQRGNIAPVDLAQAAIGPGMAVYSRHSRVTEPDGSAMRVRRALELINQVLDEVVAEQEGDFDRDTRWCVKWFTQFGWDVGKYGDAETLATALNTSVKGLERAGVVKQAAGRVNLIQPEEMPTRYDPAMDERPTVWEGVMHLSQRLEGQGVEPAARFMAAARAKIDIDATKELAYLLYNICQRRRWAAPALRFNSLVTAWPDLLAAAQHAAPPEQTTIEYPEDE